MMIFGQEEGYIQAREKRVRKELNDIQELPEAIDMDSMVSEIV